MTHPSLDVSVVVPVVERASPLVPLYEEFAPALRAAGRSFEFVFVSYPWDRHLTDPLEALVARGEPVRLIEVAQGVGETALLKVAAAQCRGGILVTLPAYRQTLADALPKLVERVESGADLAVVHRWPRRDSVVNRIQNRALQAIVGGVAGGQLHDVACGVRALRTELIAELPLYGDFVRFLPLLAMREGYRVAEVQSPVHPAAMAGRIYSPGVYFRRLIDALGLLFLLKFTDKPLRFFGLVGSVISFAGAVVLLVVFVQRLGGQGLADRPILLLGVLLVTLGIQSIALGLIGEIIVHVTASRSRRYRLQPEASSPAPSPRTEQAESGAPVGVGPSELR